MHKNSWVLLHALALYGMCIRQASSKKNLRCRSEHKSSHRLDTVSERILKQVCTVQISGHPSMKLLITILEENALYFMLFDISSLQPS